MDTASREMMEKLPEHLKARGWRFVGEESRTHWECGATRHIAVYVRPYDPLIDHERLAVVLDGRVWVSTRGRKSRGWIDAYRHAIEAMEFVDSKCRTRCPAHGGESAPGWLR